MASKPLNAQWLRFPYSNPPLALGGRALEKVWDRLHGRDREPWPDAWRAGQALGVLGAVVACKAAGVYVTNFEERKAALRAVRLYERAASFEPRDALERLDVEPARAELS